MHVWRYPHKQPHDRLAWAFNLCVFAFFLMCIFCQVIQMPGPTPMHMLTPALTPKPCDIISKQARALQVIKLQASLEAGFFWSTWVVFAIIEPITKDLASLISVFLYALIAFSLLKLLLRRVGDNKAARKVKWRATRSQVSKLVRRQKRKEAAEAHVAAGANGAAASAAAGAGAGGPSAKGKSRQLGLKHLDKLLRALNLQGTTSAVPGGPHRRKPHKAKVGNRWKATLTPDQSDGEEEESVPPPASALGGPALALWQAVSQARRQHLLAARAAPPWPFVSHDADWPQGLPPFVSYDSWPPPATDLASPRSDSSASYRTATRMYVGEAVVRLQARARGRRVRRQLQDWRRSMRPFVSNLDWPSLLPPFVSHETWPPPIPGSGGRMSTERAAVLIESVVRGYIARREWCKTMEARAAQHLEEVERGVASLPPASAERMQGMLDWAESTTAALALTVRSQQNRLLAHRRQQQQEPPSPQPPPPEGGAGEAPAQTAPPDLEKRASAWVRRQILLSFLSGSGADAGRRLLLAVLELREGAGKASSVVMERLVEESSSERRSRQLYRGQLRGRVSDAEALRLCEQLLLALEDVARLYETSDWLDEQLAQHKPQATSDV